LTEELRISTSDVIIQQSNSLRRRVSMGPFYFCDANNCPLAQGTAIKFPSLVRHEAIIDYAWNGQQVLLEKSKKQKSPTVTSPEEYRNIPFIISRIPASPEHGLRIVQHAYAEIQAAAPWTAFDNCQDFVSRAYTGRDGSETRNFVFGALAVLGLVGVAAASSR
jgi:hypothetical protein